MSQTPSPLWKSTCGRHKIHIAVLKQLVQWPSGPKAEIRLYDCNLFKTVLLIIFITNLYRRKISIFYSVQRRNSGKNTSTSSHEKKTFRMTSVDSNFNFLCGRPHGACPPPPVHMRPPEPDPLRVDVINGWPLIGNLQRGCGQWLKKGHQKLWRIKRKSFSKTFVKCMFFWNRGNTS